MAKRKMSEEQRAAAAANLAKARAAKKPASYKSIAPNVVALDDDHGLSLVNVKRYIKATTEKMAAYRRGIQTGERGAIAKYDSSRLHWFVPSSSELAARSIDNQSSVDHSSWRFSQSRTRVSAKF